MTVRSTEGQKTLLKLALPAPRAVARRRAADKTEQAGGCKAAGRLSGASKAPDSQLKPAFFLRPEKLIGPLILVGSFLVQKVLRHCVGWRVPKPARLLFGGKNSFEAFFKVRGNSWSLRKPFWWVWGAWETNGLGKPVLNKRAWRGQTVQSYSLESILI